MDVSFQGQKEYFTLLQNMMAKRHNPQNFKESQEHLLLGPTRSYNFSMLLELGSRQESMSNYISQFSGGRYVAKLYLMIYAMLAKVKDVI